MTNEHPPPAQPLDGHPLFTEPFAIALLRDLERAGSQADWNAAAGALVRFLFLHARGIDGHRTGEPARQWGNYVQGLVERGFVGGKGHRPAHDRQASIDALILKENGFSVSDSIALLRDLDRSASRFYGHPRRDQSDDALRKRIERAERAGGFRLPRGKPFGRKP